MILSFQNNLRVIRRRKDKSAGNDQGLVAVPAFPLFSAYADAVDVTVVFPATMWISPEMNAVPLTVTVPPVTLIFS